jgi:hypothetical protein
VGVVINVEKPPVQQLVRDRDLGDVLHHREISEDLHALLDFPYLLHFLSRSISLKVLRFIHLINRPSPVVKRPRVGGSLLEL